MKTKITILSLAICAFNGLKATEPTTWSDLAGSGSGYDKGEVAWGDFNNDGFIDMFQISNNSFALYQNNGNETFTNVATAKFPATNSLEQSSAIFTDINNDGNLDLIVMGWNGSASVSTVYRNLGAPDYTFTVDTNNSLVGLRTGSDANAHRVLSAVDYNNDGWTDLFMEGWSDSEGTRVVTLYRNNQGVFVRQLTPVGGTANFEQMNNGSLHTGDINRDGYVDMICSGYSLSGNYATKLYLNQGNGTFSESPAPFTGIEQGESVLFDSNNDGWLDVFVAGVGNENGWVWPGKLYINNQDGTFTVATNTNLPSGYQGLSLASGDLNNDGRTDLMIMMPWSGNANGNTAIYYNNGDGTFLANVPQTAGRARGGSMNFADFNNDNKLDYFLFGWRDGYTFPNNSTIDGGWASVFVENTCAVENAAPSTPTNLSASQVNGKWVISWNASTDAITPQAALKYNIYVQTTGGNTFSYAPANLTTGRLKTGSSTLLYNTSVTLSLSDTTNYVVGVQAVDQADAASSFATVSLSVLTSIKDSKNLGLISIGSYNKQVVINNPQSKEADYVLMSVNGQLLYSGNCQGASTVIPMTLKSGVYVVKVISNGSSVQKKVAIF